MFAQNKTAPYDYVNPFIGTDDTGYTIPGAAVPFSMVHLSPETDTVTYSNGDGNNADKTSTPYSMSNYGKNSL